MFYRKPLEFTHLAYLKFYVIPEDILLSEIRPLQKYKKKKEKNKNSCFIGQIKGMALFSFNIKTFVNVSYPTKRVEKRVEKEKRKKKTQHYSSFTL